jgi:SAM-dependent methyltransferase
MSSLKESNYQPLATPSAGLLKLQASWLSSARSRLFRQVGIAHKQRVLDLGSGYGAVTDELTRRSSGYVVALDTNMVALREGDRFEKVFRVGGDATCLPFSSATFDLVFCQCTLMWTTPLAQVIAELWRVLDLEGQLIAIEPDYGAMIEYPPQIQSKDIWLSALERSGADPRVGRRLPYELHSSGFDVKVFLFEKIYRAKKERFAFLDDLALSPDEADRLTEIRNSSSHLRAWEELSHLPFFLIIARKIS